MSPEEKNLLEKTSALVEENNQILHSMKRSMRIQRIVSFLYWAIIIVSAIGAYYFIQPYVDQLMGAYNSASSVLKTFQK